MNNNPFKTDKINLANFIKVVKKKPLSRHKYEGNRLILIFETVSEEDADRWFHQYLNSQYADWDNNKQGLLSLRNNIVKGDIDDTKYETDNINLANYIEVEKKKHHCSHRHNDYNRLFLIFEDVKKEDADFWYHKYLNSPWAEWDNNKQGLLSLLRKPVRHKNE